MSSHTAKCGLKEPSPSQPTSITSGIIHRHFEYVSHLHSSSWSRIERIERITNLHPGRGKYGMMLRSRSRSRGIYFSNLLFMAEIIPQASVHPGMARASESRCPSNFPCWCNNPYPWCFKSAPCALFSKAQVTHTKSNFTKHLARHRGTPRLGNSVSSSVLVPIHAQHQDICAHNKYTVTVTVTVPMQIFIGAIWRGQLPSSCDVESQRAVPTLAQTITQVFTHCDTRWIVPRHSTPANLFPQLESFPRRRKLQEGGNGATVPGWPAGKTVTNNPVMVTP